MVRGEEEDRITAARSGRVLRACRLSALRASRSAHRCIAAQPIRPAGIPARDAIHLNARLLGERIRYEPDSSDGDALLAATRRRSNRCAPGITPGATYETVGMAVGRDRSWTRSTLPTAGSGQSSRRSTAALALRRRLLAAIYGCDPSGLLHQVARRREIPAGGSLAGKLPARGQERRQRARQLDVGDLEYGRPEIGGRRTGRIVRTQHRRFWCAGVLSVRIDSSRSPRSPSGSGCVERRCTGWWRRDEPRR